MKRWILWLSRAWPVWALTAITWVFGQFAIWTIPAGAPVFNKVAGASLQALGALIVLFSLDGNLGLFKRQGLVSVMLAWCRDYPRKGKVGTLVAAKTGQMNASGLLASIRIQPADIDGRVAELERMVGELHETIAQNRAEVDSAITEVRREMAQGQSQHQNNLNELSEKIEASTVGGIKLQAFGVGLALLGSALSIFS